VARSGYSFARNACFSFSRRRARHRHHLRLQVLLLDGDRPGRPVEPKADDGAARTRPAPPPIACSRRPAPRRQAPVVPMSRSPVAPAGRSCKPSDLQAQPHAEDAGSVVPAQSAPPESAAWSG
jgi:hypothetical protein